MRHASGSLAAFLCAGLLALAGTSHAGPVQQDGLHEPAEGAAPGRDAPPVFTTNAGLAATPSLAASAGAAPATQSTESASSTLATELFKEVAAGANAAEPLRPKATAAHSRPAAAAAGRDEANADPDDMSLRDWGKSAVQWARQNVPWMREDPDAQHSAGDSAVPHAADWSASPLSGGPVARGTPVDPRLLAGTSGTASPDPVSADSYGGSGAQAVWGTERNLVRATVDFCRAVVEHPLTWLVVALIAIGSIVVRKIDRRPTK